MILSISSILGANLHKIIAHKSRSLADATALDFVSAKNLIFNSDSKWQFNIEYSGSQLTKDTAYTIPILYKGSESLASCSALDDFILNCSLPMKKLKQKKTLFKYLMLNQKAPRLNGII